MSSDLLRLLLLSDANTRVVLLGTAILGVACGTIGALAVLRRRALVGDAVAHASLPGVCLAWLVIGDRHHAALLIGAVLFGLLGVACVAWIRAATRVKEDAAIGLVLAVFFGLGIALSRSIQNLPGGNRAGLDGFILGKAASMVRSDVVVVSIVAAASLAAVLLLYKEFRLLCFDRGFAAAQGWPTGLLDLLLLALVCCCTVAGLPAVGVVLMVSLLVVPGAAARFWTDRLSTTLVVAGGIGLASAVLGTALSATLPPPSGALSRGWPTGPMIALAAAAIFVVSLLAAPRHGVIARRLRRAVEAPPEGTS
jgi:manganese/zinc/iron transport system permease protein